MKVGYARISTEDHDLELQIATLKAAGCERIFADSARGVRPLRPGLEDAIAELGAGDCLVVWRLDRLGRSVKQLVDLVANLAERRVDLRSLKDGIDSASAMGGFFFHVMCALAEMERELIRERTNAGLVAAKARGRVGGRPRKMTAGLLEAAQTLLAQGSPISDVARDLGVSVPTLYRYVGATKS